MPDPLKSKLLKEFRSNVQREKKHFVKKVSSNNHFQTENNKAALSQYLFEEYDTVYRKLKSFYDHLQGSHYFYFFELREDYLVFDLSFPHATVKYNGYEDLKEKTTVYISLRSKHDYKNRKQTSISFLEFEKIVTKHLYIVNFFNEHKIYDQPQKSVKQFLIEQFKEAWFSDIEDFEDYINYLNKNNEDIVEILNAKNKFTDKNRTLNKTKKENKNKNKHLKNKKIAENEKRIKELYREISKLKDENVQIKNQNDIPEEEYIKKNELQYNYENKTKLFIEREQHYLKNSNFKESFELILFK